MWTNFKLSLMLYFLFLFETVIAQSPPAVNPVQSNIVVSPNESRSPRETHIQEIMNLGQQCNNIISILTAQQLGGASDEAYDLDYQRELFVQKNAIETCSIITDTLTYYNSVRAMFEASLTPVTPLTNQPTIPVP